MAQHDLDPNLARLLAGRDEPSILEKEAQFERIYQAVEDAEPQPKAWRRKLAWTLPLVAALFAAMLLLPRASQDEFTARGTPSTAIVRGYCVHGAAPDASAATLGQGLPGRTRCEVGQRLVLRLMPPRARPFAAAYVERADGHIAWLFPGRGEPLPKQPTAETLYPRSFELSGLPPGTHRLHVVFSRQAMTRGELGKRLERRGATGADLTVVSQPLQITAPESDRTGRDETGDGTP